MNQFDKDDSQRSRQVLTLQLSNNLQELIQQKAINYIRAFEGEEEEPSHESQQWSFDKTFVMVGDKTYCLHMLTSFKISSQVLSLYF